MSEWACVSALSKPVWKKAQNQSERPEKCRELAPGWVKLTSNFKILKELIIADQTGNLNFIWIFPLSLKRISSHK